MPEFFAPTEDTLAKLSVDKNTPIISLLQQAVKEEQVFKFDRPREEVARLIFGIYTALGFHALQPWLKDWIYRDSKNPDSVSKPLGVPTEAVDLSKRGAVVAKFLDQFPCPHPVVLCLPAPWSLDGSC